MTDKDRLARGIAALIVAMVVFALVTRVLSEMVEEGETALEAIWRLARFFTIWTNFAIGVVALGIAVRGPKGQVIPAGLVLAIIAVGLVYHILLAHLVSFEGLDRFADFALHTAVPIGWTLLWLVFLPKGALGPRHIPVWMAFPAIYAIYALIRGALDGTYPYGFLNLDTLGAAGVAINAAGLLVAFALGSLAILAVSRWEHRRTRRAG